MEFGRDVHSGQHLVDIGTAAVNEHRIDSDEFQKRYVVHDGGLEFFVDHRIPAVFDDDGLSGEALYIRQSLDQNFGFAYKFTHVVLVVSFRRDQFVLHYGFLRKNEYQS